MPALNYKARFAAQVESGAKRRTIRARRRDGRDPKPGDMLYHYTGMRTKACRRLGVSTCEDVTPIQIFADETVMEGSAVLTGRNLLELARLDGFVGVREFLDFFCSVHGLPFAGLVISWGEIGSGLKAAPDDPSTAAWRLLCAEKAHKRRVREAQDRKKGDQQ